MNTSPWTLATPLATLAAAALMTGCALSGVGGTSEFQCKAPEGVPCQSVSGVHYNERAGNLPAQRAAHRSSAAPSQVRPTRAASVGDGSDPTPELPVYPLQGEPVLGAIRSDPVLIRIWIAPWEDADGDLNEESRVYLQIDAGRWLIEHNRARIRQTYTPLTPLPPLPQSLGAGSGGNGTGAAPTPAQAASQALPTRLPGIRPLGAGGANSVGVNTTGNTGMTGTTGNTGSGARP